MSTAALFNQKINKNPGRLVNEPLLRRVVTAIENTPHRWNQSWYASYSECGTQFCLAGWALHLSGYDVTHMALKHPSCYNVFEKAQDLLGLSTTQAQKLFWWSARSGFAPHPTVDDLKKRITEVTGLCFDEQIDQHALVAA